MSGLRSHYPSQKDYSIILDYSLRSFKFFYEGVLRAEYWTFQIFLHIKENWKKVFNVLKTWHLCLSLDLSFFISLLLPLDLSFSRKTNTPFQQHTIFSNTEMLWGGINDLFSIYKFFLKYKIFSLRKCWFKPKEFIKIQNISDIVSTDPTS